MDLKPYVANLKAFVGSLPMSGIAFLYFQKSETDKKFIPHINTNAKEWVFNKNDLYILQSNDAHYCYVYKESEIKYKIYLDKGAVSAFEPQTSSYGLVSGGSGVVVKDTNWGNHLTVGLMKSFVTKKILLVTHTTTYVPNPDNPVEYHKEPSVPCNVYLESTLDETCECISNGKPGGFKLDLYNKTDDETVIPIIKAIHRYIWNGVPKGGRKSRARKQSNVLIGPKGGKYRLIKGRRVYVGGYGDFKDPSGGFVQSFVVFIKEVALNIVASYRPELYDAIVVDDGSDHVLLRYRFRAGYDMSHMFMIGRGIVTNGWRAYVKPVDERTVVETEALDTFVAIVDGFRNVISVEA